MTIKIMSQETKERVRELEGQKVILEDQLDNLSYFKSFDKKIDIKVRGVEEEIFEIEDTIKKLIA
jgi:hypothetical protein